MKRFLVGGGNNHGTNNNNNKRSKEIITTTFVQCPLCLKEFISTTITIHASMCGDDWNKTAATSTTSTSTNTPPRIETTTTTNNTETTPPPKNAFQTIMAASKRPIDQISFNFNSQSNTVSLIWDNNNNVETAKSSTTTTINVGKKLPVKLQLIINQNIFQQHNKSQQQLECSNSSNLTIGVLKSILQKAFRRRDLETVQQAASELAIKSWTEFIRRIPIIIIEDSILHPDLDALTFLLLIDGLQDFQPTKEIIQFAITIICEAAISNVKDSLICRSASSPITDFNLNNVWIQEPYKKLSNKQASLIKSLLIRAEYGGMPSDVLMLKRAAWIWMYRFAEQQINVDWISILNRLNGISINSHSRVLSPLNGLSETKSRSVIVGIDCHIQPRLFDDIIKQHFNNQQEIFEKLMWILRAGINVRAEIGSETFQYWDLTNELIIEMARNAKQKAIQLETYGHVGNMKLSMEDEWFKILHEIDSICLHFIVTRR